MLFIFGYTIGSISINVEHKYDLSQSSVFRVSEGSQAYQ